MTLKVTVQIDAGQPYDAVVETMDNDAGGKYTAVDKRVLRPGDAHDFWIYGSRGLKITEQAPARI